MSSEIYGKEVAQDESKSFLGGVHHPWRRLLARTVDLLPIGYLLPPNINETLIPIGALIVFYLLWLPVEALFLSRTGTTPGKWIFGIRITTVTGENLSYGQALKRSFLVFFQGEGFSIPIINIFTRFFAYRRLTKTGGTLWDTSVGSVVTHKKWGIFRVILVFSG